MTAALRGIVCSAFLLMATACGEADNRVVQSGATAAQRIVTLAPHLAELVDAVGAADRLVAISAYTTYPPTVTALPVIGDAFGLDQEQLLLLEPDLLLAWESGTPNHVIDELQRSGYRVESIVTTSIYDVPQALRRIGELTGQTGQAGSAAQSFSEQISKLVASNADASRIRVFYQIDTRPLYTINGKHFLSEIINTCGGTNIFADLNDIAPTVSVEAVIERNPEVLLAAGETDDPVFNHWDRWRNMDANRYGNRFLLTGDVAQPTPRIIISAAQSICSALDRARANRIEVGND